MTATTMTATVQAPPRRLPPALRRARLRLAGVLAALLAAGAAANPLRPLPIDLCGFKWLTGLPCPTCGLTRAMCRAIQGDIAGSLAAHPAGVIAAAALVVWLAWLLLEAWQGRPLAESIRRPLIRATAALAGAIAVAFWISELVL
jgi:hypothetical protein